MTTKIICIANQKGGVGKTTTAVNLAHGLALKGKPTLLIDLDPQGQCATALGMNPEPGVFNWLGANRPVKESVRYAREELHLIPGDRATSEAQMLLNVRSAGLDYLAEALRPLTRNGGLKYIVLDTSPSLGGLQERALFAAEVIIVPTATDFLSADSVARTMETVDRNRSQGWVGGAWVLPTFYDEVTAESKRTLDELRGIYGAQMLPEIHRATILRECAAQGETIWEVDGQSRAGEEYAALVYQVLEVG